MIGTCHKSEKSAIVAPFNKCTRYGVCLGYYNDSDSRVAMLVFTLMYMLYLLPHAKNSDNGFYIDDVISLKGEPLAIDNNHFRPRIIVLCRERKPKRVEHPTTVLDSEAIEIILPDTLVVEHALAPTIFPPLSLETEYSSLQDVPLTPRHDTHLRRDTADVQVTLLSGSANSLGTLDGAILEAVKAPFKEQQPFNNFNDSDDDETSSRSSTADNTGLKNLITIDAYFKS